MLFSLADCVSLGSVNKTKQNKQTKTDSEENKTKAQSTLCWHANTSTGVQSQGSRKEWRREMRLKWGRVSEKGDSPTGSWPCGKSGWLFSLTNYLQKRTKQAKSCWKEIQAKWTLIFEWMLRYLCVCQIALAITLQPFWKDLFLTNIFICFAFNFGIF